MRLLILSALVAVALLPACASRVTPPAPPELHSVSAPPVPLAEPPPPPEAPAELAFASVHALKMPQVW